MSLNQAMKFFNRIPEILVNPHPLNLFIVRNLVGSIALGGFVFSFLYVFKPFGLHVLPGEELVTVTLGYGLVTTGYLIIHLTVLAVFFRESSWTVWKEIINTLVIITMIGLCNFLYHAIYFSHTFNFITLLKLQFETLAVSFIPVSLIILLQQNFLLKKYLKEADEINRKKDYEFSEGSDEKLITISAQNPKNNLEYSCNDILFCHAQDNYVIVHFIRDLKHTKEIIRTTLRKTREDLLEHDNYFHSHKSYIVNLDKVKKVTGNAQGLKLHFDSVNEIIPVSRKLHQEFLNIYGMK